MVKVQSLTWTSFLLISCLWIEVLVNATSKFGKVSTNDLDELETYQSFESTLQCARMCDRARSDEPPCEAFDFKSISNRCKIYKKSSGKGGTAGYEAYMNRPYCDTNGGFQAVQRDGHLFCYLLTGDLNNFSSATHHCASFGAYLLHLDSVAEIFAARDFATQRHYAKGWVGVSDIANEGQWVTNKDGAPMNMSIWQWSSGEPNGFTDENCGNLIYNQQKLNDNDCNKKKSYICERDV